MRQTILNHVTFGGFTATLPDILGSVDIGMRLVSLRATPKIRLITAVALLTAATLGARLGDSPHGHLSDQPRNAGIEQDQLPANRLKGGGIRPGI
jgi:hypothetical protein